MQQEIQYANYSQLKEMGIKNIIIFGKNDWGFEEKVLITNDGRQWDYMPEDQLYELKTDNLITIKLTY